MKRVIFHIDVNSAYLSWEAVSRLAAGDTVDLREIPAAIGGDIETRHGVILRQYSDVIEQFSVDEAFVDMTGTDLENKG